MRPPGTASPGKVQVVFWNFLVQRPSISTSFQSPIYLFVSVEAFHSSSVLSVSSRKNGLTTVCFCCSLRVASDYSGGRTPTTKTAGGARAFSVEEMRIRIC